MARGSAAAPADDGEQFFEQKIRPVLARSCQKCHGPKKQEGGLRLDARDALVRGGETGPAIVPGSPGKSLLLDAVFQAGELSMPPDGKLSDGQIGDLKAWIERGAPWPKDDTAIKIRSGEITDEDRRFWSFQPIADPPVPTPKDASRVQNFIDAFLLARLQESGRSIAPPVDRRTWIRRATFDLTGLPPTTKEIADFLDDSSPRAFATAVDRLLASPRYGERWGRHWLDVVRYADTAGETADYPIREAYRYRDYVVDAFNRDKPYDQFVREQIAGDLLAAKAPADRYAEMVTATGFLAISRRFGFDPENYHHLTIQDTIDTLGQAFLGLSPGCARCHNHKFDPITTGDYYALYGILDSTRYAFPGSEEKKRPRDFVPLIPPDQASTRKKAYDAALAKIDADLKALDEDRTAERIALVNARADLTNAGPYPIAYAVAEGTPHNARIQKRGEPSTPGEEVPRRFLQILGGDSVPANTGSGRLALAEWLTRPTNPLAARVMVNRVWQHHFGRGLVSTVNDFGRRGRPPSHPELLDALARRFRDGGWSIKALHREIMLSSTYQMAGSDGSSSPTDPDDPLLPCFPRRRLDAEEIRDAMLFAAGTLDLSPAGPHPFPPVETWGFTQHNPFSAVYDSKHRSVYLMTPRLKRHPYLALFDGADPNSSTGRRLATTVPTQSLFFMNDPFVHEQAEALAKREISTSSDDRARLQSVFERTLGRLPTPEETDDSLAFLSAERAEEPETPDRDLRAWSALSRTLFARNEFLFID